LVLGIVSVYVLHAGVTSEAVAREDFAYRISKCLPMCVVPPEHGKVQFLLRFLVKGAELCV
jgi:hypothetical protein